jgi:hypothetical protein
MLSFQWDIFLLETGFACFVLSLVTAASLPTETVRWLLRFQLFKIMLMSGVVKTQAQCPTWENLTALEYHFASQCIPTAESWYAHQLPPTVLRAGVAATFVTQIPGPFLLLFPSVSARRLGALLQIPLQVLIILTGNYNWFNHQVLVLLLLVWEPDFIFGADAGSSTATPTTNPATAAAQGRQHVDKTQRARARGRKKQANAMEAVWDWAWLIFSVLLVVGSTVRLIGISFEEETTKVPPLHPLPLPPFRFFFLPNSSHLVQLFDIQICCSPFFFFFIQLSSLHFILASSTLRLDKLTCRT